jgi:hypothetical protein
LLENLQTAQDKNAPAGFEKMPKSGDVYKKMGFRIVNPVKELMLRICGRGNI